MMTIKASSIRALIILSYCFIATSSILSIAMPFLVLELRGVGFHTIDFTNGKLEVTIWMGAADT